jgi:protein-S-isoprenylcysteine O-methyltransferase Ste14
MRGALKDFSHLTRMAVNLLKSVLHNIGVVLASLGLAYLGTSVDSLLRIPKLSSPLMMAFGGLLISLGFLLRVWAAVHFYAHKMRVISLEPQSSLVTTGPYRYSRNPLYLGGNVFCFFGAALLLGSPTALIVTAVHLPLVNLMIRREEKQLEERFGEEFRAYKKQVRRWL